MEKEKQIENIENIVDVILPIMKDGEFSARNLARALNKSGYGNVKEAVKEFAELVKIAFHYEFNDLIPAPILSKKIDELIKEVCGE